MDPLDQEKPWTAVQQIALITVVIGIVYLFFRFAVVVPDWGIRLIFVATFVGALLYYFLAFRRGRRDPNAPRASVTHIVTGVLLVIAASAPLWAALYYAWKGAAPWN